MVMADPPWLCVQALTLFRTMRRQHIEPDAVCYEVRGGQLRPRTHARTYGRTHGRTHARTHAFSHTEHDRQGTWSGRSIDSYL